MSGIEGLQRYFVHGTQYIDERAVLHDVPNNAEYYYFQRELYSVERLVNNRGHEVERYSYDAYGRPVITLISDADLTGDRMVDYSDANVVAGLFTQPPCTVGPPVDVVEDTLIDP